MKHIFNKLAKILATLQIVVQTKIVDKLYFFVFAGQESGVWSSLGRRVIKLGAMAPCEALKFGQGATDISGILWNVIKLKANIC